MKRNARRVFTLILTLLMIVSSVPLSFAGKSINLYQYYLLSSENPTLPFDLGVHADGHHSRKFWVFLPNEFEGETLHIRSRSAIKSAVGDVSVAEDKMSFDISAEDGVRAIVDGNSINVMHSCLPSVSITIDSGYSIDTIHADKEEKIKAHVQIDGAENDKYNLESTAIEMKTRGNTTFYFDKKPYQIKFDKKTDIFGMGKAKKWILLANYIDGTGVRNKLAFDIAEQLGLPYTPESVFVDLYVDGEYKGNYQIIEKIEVGSSRVPLEDEKGVIFEMDTDLRIDASDINFRGAYTDKTYTLKDYVTDLEDTSTPEQRAKNMEVLDFVTEFVNDTEEVIYDKNSTWEDVEKYIDAESFIQYYFVTEIFEQIDCTLASTYFYVDGPGDVLHCGPIWDFDRICGWQNDYDQTWNTDYVKNMVENTDYQRCDLFKQLFRYPEFVKMVNDFFDEKVRDIVSSDKLITMIDDYQDAMWPSLMMNFSRWYYVFRDRTSTMDEIMRSGTYEDWVIYVTDLMKNWIVERNKYLENAYGKDFPILSYSVCGEPDEDVTWYDRGMEWLPAVSGGCMTYMTTVSGLEMSLSESEIDGGITYTLRRGKDEYTASDGERLTSDEADMFTGLSVKLTGNMANYFDVQYRVLTARNVKENQGFKGWSSWAQNGTLTGSTVVSSNYSPYAIKKIQVRLAAKKPVSYGTVNFNVMGEVTSESGVVGNLVELDAPIVKGFRFEGWYFTPEFMGSPAVRINYSKSPITLYARYTEIEAYEAGDVNCDGDVTVADVLILRKYVTGALNEEDFTSLGYDFALGDVNGDGDITMTDVLTARKITTGAI